MTVATWNLFHGRTQPPTRANLLGAFSAALAEREWDVCGLQEVPPWWVAGLAAGTGSSARMARTSLLRSAWPRAQAAIHDRDPERIGVRGAGANVVLVRPEAGRIDQHRMAVLRRAPQRRTLHAVRLVRPRGRGIWIANVHTHNRPESQAAVDLVRALRVARGWAGDERLVLLGDLNLTHPQGLASAEGFAWLHGQRVDHVLARGLRSDGGAYADRVQPRKDRTMSDHRMVGVRIADA
ncbi:MAG: endonuclease/exonuclease/phosphatase family protein [Solirubrobacteraceae bacterium]|nr:endonuclease/exonuclease/phosphatase family protein [Solirubrobacteraceae bacterium]